MRKWQSFVPKNFTLKLFWDFSGTRETMEKLKIVQAQKGQNLPKDVINDFGLDTFQFFKCFSGSRKIPKQFQSFVVFLMKLEDNNWQPLVIWQNLTRFHEKQSKSSLFVLTENKAGVICLILLSFSYPVECSQLQKRCDLFSCNSCLRNAPNF